MMIKTFAEFIFERENKVLYSAVILNEKSHKLLVEKFKNEIPNDWKIYAHHMTICFGELPRIYKSLVGKKVTLTVTHIGELDNVITVKVKGLFKLNKQFSKTPDNAPMHITIATKKGTPPVMSNYIKDWKKIKEFTVDGIVEEVYQK